MEDILVRLYSFNVNVDVNNDNNQSQNRTRTQTQNQNMGKSFRIALQMKERQRKLTIVRKSIKNYGSICSSDTLEQRSRLGDVRSLCYCNQNLMTNDRHQFLMMPSFSSSLNERHGLSMWSSWFYNNNKNNCDNKTAKLATKSTKRGGRRRRRMITTTPVAAFAASTITLCHLKLAILILSLLLVQSYVKLCRANGQQSNNFQHQHQNNNYFHHHDHHIASLPQRISPLPEAVSITMPAYSPTRTPINPSHHSSNKNNNNVVPISNSASTLPSISVATTTSQQQQQQQVFANRNLDPKPSSSSSKFTRTNELDVFLDDINHSELRAIASGKPINDLFKPKVMPPVELSGGHSNDGGEQNPNSAPGKQQEETARTQLDSSGSEQQIYSECALILQRTYVKNINDPKHQMVPFGKTEQACISYKHIDKAIEQAKHKLKFKEFNKRRKKASKKARKPSVPFDIIYSSLEPPEDLIAAIGEINMATTQIIADQFDLSNDELLNGLPLIDMSKTKFWSICPLLVKQDIKCEISRFRTQTGHCNNLKHPTWGAAMTPFARYLPPVHPDGIWIPRKSIVTEISFELGEGHSETHSNIAPSMPAPVFNEPIENDNSNNNRYMQHIHNHQHNHMRRDISDSNSNDNDGVIEAEAEFATEMSASPSVQFVRHAHMDASMVDSLTHDDPAISGNDIKSLKQLEPGSGMIHAPSSPSPPLPHHHHQAVASLVHHQHHHHMANSANIPASVAPPSDALIGERAIDAHYHQSIRPNSPFIATATPMLGSHHQPPAPLPPPPSEPGTSVAASGQHNHKTHSMAHELPSARLVTSIVHRDLDLPSHDFSILFMSWGQLLDHDMTRAAQLPPSIKCCGPENPKHKLCLPIHVPANDPFYSKFNVKCLEFRRTLAGIRPNCVLGPRVHQNAITSPIDANFVYGSSQAMAEGLRLFKGGRLRDRDWFKQEGLKPLLPAQEIEPDLECIARPKDLFCFLAGDVRVNEQTHLTVLHTLYMREHNRMADKLAELNPHWNDERIYQETRHIMAAGVQHVMVNEYIPLLIGKKMTELYNLTAQPAHHVAQEHHHHHDYHHPLHLHHGHSHGHYWHGYDPSVTTSVSNSFAAAAFRQGHTFVQGSVERYNKYHEFVASEKLRHLFKQPFLIYQPGVLDELTSGMINQPSQSYDPFISEDISGHLFQPPELEFGHDLAAINLQRGREQGLPGYNLFREWCGLPRAETFEQLEPYLTNHTAYHYSRLYKHVDDIDLWSGGVSERKLPGAAIGPTFACIIARQFSNTRRGDRFWYENPGLPSSFTPEQLNEIRKITLAKILCANSDDLPTIQRWALRMPHPVLNPRLPCEQIPEINLQYWQEQR